MSGEPRANARVKVVLQKLGKYDLIAEVGRGAMGAVYKAHDPAIDRLVALKTITTSLVGNPELLERFYREARSAGKLQHPNIVTVYELGQEGETPFIAMEFLEGESLEKIVARKQDLSLLEKVGFIVPVSRALEFAHKRGVTHRDIKPGNVMVTKDGAVKVVDFGIARIADAALETRTNTLIGTLAYMSPQQLRGERADARSDIWSLGVTFYELMCYQRPFDGENHTALMLNIIDTGSEPRPIAELAPDCPAALAELIGKMLQKDIGKRFQSMEEVLLDLEPVWKTIQEESVSLLLADGEAAFRARDLPRARNLARKALEINGRNARAKILLEQVDEAKQTATEAAEARTVFAAGAGTMLAGIPPAQQPGATGNQQKPAEIGASLQSRTGATLQRPAGGREMPATILAPASEAPSENLATTWAAPPSSPGSHDPIRTGSPPEISHSSRLSPAGSGGLVQFLREKPLAAAIPVLVLVLLAGTVGYFVIQRPAQKTQAQATQAQAKDAEVANTVPASNQPPTANQPIDQPAAVDQYRSATVVEPANGGAVTAVKTVSGTKLDAQPAVKPHSGDSHAGKGQASLAKNAPANPAPAVAADQPKSAPENAVPSAAVEPVPAESAGGKCQLLPSDIGIWLSRADTNRAKGNYVDAEREYNTVLACDPRNEQAQTGLTKTKEAEALPTRSPN